MGGVTDIRQVKRDLRQKYRAIRENMEPEEKNRYDEQILKRLISLPVYQNARAILCFVATPIEVETRGIIQRAFADGKLVAVPKCLDRRGNMDFFVIHSLRDLVPGEFALLEPDIRRVKRLSRYERSICVLPAFAFDSEGYRLGFGMGYYDRFLRQYTGQRVGVCYNSCLASALPRGRFDQAADYVVTPKYTITTQRSSQKSDTEEKEYV